MTQSKNPGATPRRYDPAYKAEAVRMWEASGRAAEEVARELGVRMNHLYEWRRELRGPGAPRVAQAAALPAMPQDKESLKAEVIRLRREVARLTEQREILKKAAGILSEPPPRGMPGSRP